MSVIMLYAMRILWLCFFITCIMVMMPGCVYNSGKIATKDCMISQEYQARFSDIPFPFDAEIVLEEDMLKDEGLSPAYGVEADSFIITMHPIVCLTHASISELCSFYRQEMEQLGWNERGFFQENSEKQSSSSIDHDCLFIFQRPGNKICVIRIGKLSKKHAQHVCVRYYRLM